jgi:uroporphyrin-III C-methyltransferase / precorrin-2 dehydrogenase / sirohydrochlorin ferrochelatase
MRPRGPATGRVTLIGCGPGDPELLTLKALKALAKADVLVVDRLVDSAIIDMASPEARVIYAGKEPDGPSTPQDEINRILVREALLGFHVARLKGGDGFVFGRAAEELAAVRAAGLEVDVIPGVTAAHACAASIALPITLRQSVRQFSVVTGATADGEIDLDWEALARPGQAFAIYMGVRSAARVKTELIKAGAAAETTVVIVENGTLPHQRTVAATLGSLPEALTTLGIKGPAIIFIGLSWEAANLSVPATVEFYNGSAVSRDVPANVRKHTPA